MEDILYTVPEVVKLTKTSKGYVYNLIKAGLLPVIKLGSYKIRRSSLEAFIAKYEGQDLTDPFNIKQVSVQCGET